LKTLELPIKSIEEISQFRAGEEIFLEGVIYVGRDQVHKELAALFKTGDALPFELTNQGIYYMGPSPAGPGQIIGAAGPTTASRMDPFTPLLLENGLKVVVGKGPRSQKVRDSFLQNSALYLHAYGGCGALYSRTVLSWEKIAFDYLGPEALLKMVIHKFPVLVAFDLKGNSVYPQ
jgi:fumarate hydratase subunit beta